MYFVTLIYYTYYEVTKVQSLMKINDMTEDNSFHLIISKIFCFKFNMFLFDGRQLFEEQLSQSNSFRKHINKMNFFIVGNHGKFFCEFNMENISKKK